jgi:hypothetical protein
MVISCFMQPEKFRSGDTASAIEALKYAASEGEPLAQWNLAKIYANGDGVSRDDLKAYDYFSQIVSNYDEDNPDRRDFATVSSSIDADSDEIVAFPAVRPSAVPAAWTAHSRVARNSGTSWRSYPGSAQRPAPPRASSSLRRIQTVEPLRTSPLQTSPATPPNQSPERFSPKVADSLTAYRLRGQIRSTCPADAVTRSGTGREIRLTANMHSASNPTTAARASGSHTDHRAVLSSTGRYRSRQAAT